MDHENKTVYGLFDGLGLESARVVGFAKSNIPSHCAIQGPYRWNCYGFTENSEFFVVEISNHKGVLCADLLHKSKIEGDDCCCGRSVANIFHRLLKEAS